MRHALLDTLDQITREQAPNFFRLYLNPHVARACFCLARMVQDAWYPKAPEPPEFQTFLANSFDEALSGAVKLARFVADAQGRAKTGLIVGAQGRLNHFAALQLGDCGRVELIPDLHLAGEDALVRAGQRFGYGVLFPPRDAPTRNQPTSPLPPL